MRCKQTLLWPWKELSLLYCRINKLPFSLEEDIVFIVQAICYTNILEKIVLLLERGTEMCEIMEDCLPTEGRDHEFAVHCPIPSDNQQINQL